MKRKITAATTVAIVMLSMGSAIAAPANDDAADATPIGSVPFTDGQDTSSANRESGEPQPCGQIGATVWYRYEAAGSGTLIAHTLGSNFDAALAVYTGSLFDLDLHGCSTDAVGRQARIEFEIYYPGQTFFFQVGGERSDSGSLVFSLARPAALSGTVTDAADGDELQEICVDVFSTGHVLIGSGTTDTTGEYFIRPIPEGTAKVRFTDCLEGTYQREWYSDGPTFADADEVLLVAGATTGAVDAALAVRPGPDMAVQEVTVTDVPIAVAGTDVPVPTTYNREVAVTTDNLGPLAGRKVIVHAEVCPRAMGSCKVLGDRHIGRIEPGERTTTVFDWNGIDTIGDVVLFVSVYGTRDTNWDDNTAESDRYVWVGGTGFGARLCRIPGQESLPCVT